MRIRSDVLRTYQSIHTWTGIIAGLVLFIGFYAGSLSMFEDEISTWASPPSFQLPQVSPDKYDQLVVQVLSNYEQAQEGFTVNFAENLSPITWYEQGGGRTLTLNDIQQHATLSEQGELITQVKPTNELGELIDMLHRTAGIAGKVAHEDLGVLVLGAASVLYFLALVSGVIFLLPTLVKSFFALRKNKGANRFWLDSHNLVGILSLPFHLIIAWTVVVFAFHDVLYGGLGVIYDDEPLFAARATAQTEFSVESLPPISIYLNKVEALTDGYQVSKINFTGLKSKRASVGIDIINTDEMMRNNTGDFIYMDPYSLEVTYSSIPMSEDDYYVPLVASFFSLHFGGFGGELGKWLYFIMGLLGAFIFYSGNLLWLEKRRIKQPKQKRSVRVMAALTVGICLGSMLAVVVTMLSSKWLYLFTDQVNYYYLFSYYFVFFAALLYSFIRGAALSAIHLQLSLALACLFIPLTSIIAAVLPNIGLWTSTSTDMLVFDVVALAFSGSFYWAAKKTKHRAYKGERNSIWCLER